MVVFLWLLMVAGAWAHPFAETLYGHQVVMYLSGDQVRVDYGVEVPTIDMLRALGLFLKGRRPTAAEREAFTRAQLDEFESNLRLLVSGATPTEQPVRWKRLPAVGPSGQGDGRITVYRLSLQAALPVGTRTVHLVNENLPDTPSVFSSELLVDDTVAVDACSLFKLKDGRIAVDLAGRWRAEEQLRELSVSFHLRSAAGAVLHRGYRRLAGDVSPADGGASRGWMPARAALAGVREDPLRSFVEGSLTPGVVLLAFAVAIVLGAAHAMSPGHGKTLVAAYLLGERRNLRHAVWLGLVVTATHTAGVYLLGFLAWGLEDLVKPEIITSWLELVSGVMVLWIGAVLIRSRWRSWQAGRGEGRAHGHTHRQEHTREHTHPHLPEHSHGDAHGHSHLPEPGSGWRGLVALGVSRGLAPCPSALVLLLTAISFQRVAFGLALVFAFSVGLALVVVAVGAVVVLLGDRLHSRVDEGRFAPLFATGGAFVVTMVGIGITWRGVQAVLGG